MRLGHESKTSRFTLFIFAKFQVTHPAPGNWNGTLVNALLHHCDLPVMKNLSKQADGEMPTANVQDESDASDDEEVEGFEDSDPLAGIT